MLNSSYLLFFDKIPVNDDLKKYFSQFNIQIEQKYQLEPIPQDKISPAAILIHWSILQNTPQILGHFYNRFLVPILIISDTANEEACIKVLEMGADDFIVKPIYPRELHARINAIKRRVLRAQASKESEKEVLLFTNWKLYPASRRVFDTSNQELLLSVGEYDLLLTFVQQPKQVLDREFLLQITKNSDLNPFDRRVDVQISRLRQKIEPDKKNPTLIKTIRNGGYMFTAQVEIHKENETN